MPNSVAQKRSIQTFAIQACVFFLLTIHRTIVFIGSINAIRSSIADASRIDALTGVNTGEQ